MNQVNSINYEAVKPIRYQYTKAIVKKGGNEEGGE